MRYVGHKGMGHREA